MVEVVVADETSIRLAAELSILLFVETFEERALIPGDTLVFLEGPAEILLGDIQHADLQHLIRLGVVDEVVKSAPRSLELLKLLVVKDEVDLLGERMVDLGDDRLDSADDIIRNYRSLAQSLLGKRPYGHLDRGTSLIGLGFELLLQQ